MRNSPKQFTPFTIPLWWAVPGTDMLHVKWAVTRGTNHMSDHHIDEQGFGRIKHPVLLCANKSIYYLIKACALFFANVNYL